MMLPGFPEAQPVEGLIGGLMIGVAAAMMLLGLGRIAGVSGLTARMTTLSRGGAPWPVAALFIVGLLVGPLLVLAAGHDIPATYPPGWAWLVAGGLLVGFGTRLGSGCTSGHGVCGMSRLSRRSILSVLTFIASGAVTVAIVNAFGGGW